MKIIYSLFLLICFVNYSLSSGDGVTVNILGPVLEAANECQGKFLIFYIPVSIVGLEEGKNLDLTLPVASPDGLTAQCKNVFSQGQEYLGCSIDPLNNYFLNTPISFHTTYKGPDTINVEGWEDFIGQNPVIASSATCPNKDLYDFSDLNNFSDECYKDHPGYHLVKAYGKLVPVFTNGLQKTEVELEFKMELLVNSAKVVASCKVTELPDEQNSSSNGLLQCAFVGNGNVQFVQYLAQAETKEFLLVRGSEPYTLPNKCESSDTSKSSWLSVSGLLLIALILL